MWQLQIVIASFILCQIQTEYVDSLTNSETCPGKNMVFYPLDENYTTWICDCSVKYLYYPENDSCYAAYRQGPCPLEQYLVLSAEQDFGVCEKNPCLNDGLVPFNGSCYHLGHTGPPCEDESSIIIDDFKVACSYVKSFGIITAPGKTCPVGSRRIALGVCKKVL